MSIYFYDVMLDGGSLGQVSARGGTETLLAAADFVREKGLKDVVVVEAKEKPGGRGVILLRKTSGDDPITIHPQVFHCCEREWFVKTTSEPNIRAGDWHGHEIVLDTCFVTGYNDRKRGAPPTGSQLDYFKKHAHRYRVSKCGLIVYDLEYQMITIAEVWRASTTRRLRELLGRPAPVMGEEDRKRLARAMAEASRRQAETSLLTHKNMLRRHENNIRSYRDHLMGEIRAAEELARIIAATEVPKSTSEKEALEMLERIEKLPKIRNVSILNSTLYFESDPIVLEAMVKEKKTRFDIGRVDVELNLDTSEIRIFNLDRTAGGQQHPHVDGQGIPCFGEIKASLPELVAKKAIPEAVSVIIRFLWSINTADDWGKHIGLWPVLEDIPPLQESTPKKKLEEAVKEKEKVVVSGAVGDLQQILNDIIDEDEANF